MNVNMKDTTTETGISREVHTQHQSNFDQCETTEVSVYLNMKETVITNAIQNMCSLWKEVQLDGKFCAQTTLWRL